MRKFCLIALIVIMGLLALSAYQASAETWHTANQKTIGWDAVTQDVDGDPIPSGHTVSYKVFLSNALVTDKSDAMPVATATSLDAVVTLQAKGSYFVGVQAFLVPDGESEPVEGTESTIAWSDNPADCEGQVTFGLRMFAQLKSPNLKPPPPPGG